MLCVPPPSELEHLQPLEEERSGPVSLSSTEAFTETASICREFLSTFLAGTCSVWRPTRSPDPPSAYGLQPEGPRSRSWVMFLTSPQDTKLRLTSLAQCSGLSSLYIQQIATDAMLRAPGDG